MNVVLKEILLEDVILLYSSFIEDNVLINITTDLIHFINNDIDVQFGNYSRIPTSLLFMKVE